MARVKRGVVAGRRHKKILKKAKGYFNARRKVFRTAKQAVSRRASMLTAAVARRNGNTAHCGSRASTRQRVCAV